MLRDRSTPGPAVTMIAVLLALLSGSAAARPSQASAGPSSEEFFIVSSIDAPGHRLVVKRPTEVTLVLCVTAATTYRDERGRPIALSTLRAGDTAFIRTTGATGSACAVSVRLGPMTVEELARRYPEVGRAEPAPRDASH